MSLKQRLRASAQTQGDRKNRLQIREITDPADLDAADTVGAALRSARLRRGQDIAAVAREIRIRREHIEAIEENDLSGLPGTAYALGFVRTYATHLELDGDECVRRFKSETTNAHPDKRDFTFPEAREDVRLPQGSMLILAAVLGIAIYGGWYLSVSADRGGSAAIPPAPAAQQPMADAVSQPEDAPSAANENAVEAAAAPNNANSISAVALGGPSLQLEERAAAADPDPSVSSASGPIDNPGLAGEAAASSETGAAVAATAYTGPRVVLRALSKAWMRVEDSENRVLVQQELAPGETYGVPDQTGLILSVRDAGALELIVDGQSLGALGESGQPLPGIALDPTELKNARAS